MKTAAKVFIILGMIFGFWYILPLIFGGIALGQMKTQKPSTGVSVCVLLFCSLLGGIFLLCSDEKEYASAPAYSYTAQGYAPQQNYNPYAGQQTYAPQQNQAPSQGYNPYSNQQNNSQ